MTRYFVQAVVTSAAFVILSPIQAEVSCARCKKIEAERAQEQAEHPQPAGYYDDQANLQQKETDSKKTPSEGKNFFL
jgi:hypothetical protein